MRPWRKVHAGLVTSDKLANVSDGACCLYVLLLAGRDDKDCYPCSTVKLRWLTASRSWSDIRRQQFLDELLAAGLVSTDGSRLAITILLPTVERAPGTTGLRAAWGALRRRLAPIVFERDCWQCRQCGSTEFLEVDHVYPLARGGSNDEANLQTLCRPCNRRKSMRVVA